MRISLFCLPHLCDATARLLLLLLLTRHDTEQGAIGGAAQKIGGPLAKDGAIGHAFTTDGAVGGTVQGALGGNNGGKRSN